MERVTGIGGAFFRARDPDALSRRYCEHLGINPMSSRPEQGWMINFRVRDLDAILAQLREAGARVDEDVQVMEGIGRFGWASDPKGNRFEL